MTQTRLNDAHSENHTLREQLLWALQQTTTTAAVAAAVRSKTTTTTTGAANG
jgi:hypothetical protein